MHGCTFIKNNQTEQNNLSFREHLCKKYRLTLLAESLHIYQKSEQSHQQELQ